MCRNYKSKETAKISECEKYNMTTQEKDKSNICLVTYVYYYNIQDVNLASKFFYGNS